MAQTGQVPQAEEVKKGKKSPKPKKEKKVNLNYIRFFKRPELVDTLPADAKISQVFAKSQYCYALNEETNDVYSWGMGENYVLGSRDDDN